MLKRLASVSDVSICFRMDYIMVLLGIACCFSHHRIDDAGQLCRAGYLGGLLTETVIFVWRACHRSEVKVLDGWPCKETQHSQTQPYSGDRGGERRGRRNQDPTNRNPIRGVVGEASRQKATEPTR